MTLPMGSRLGPYEILSAIGAGGMGEVYRARDSKLGRDVAIKVLPEAFARDSDRMARFGREAKLLASLNHSNIASIYGLEDANNTRALVMELAGGPTLADRIAQGPLPIEDALRIAKQICDALEYAHEKGIVHRDLKPANIKVAADDTVKILDFGLAKALESNAAFSDISTSPTLSRLATQAGILLGTASYMSPEQAKAKPVDRRADIWAFGCVLYEMLTGKQAYHGETVTDTLAAILTKEPDWALLPTATPMRVRVLLQRCLQKDVRQRLQAVGDARISLDEVLSGAPEGAPGLAAAVPVWRRALPWAVAALAIGFAVVARAPWRAATSPSATEPVRFQIQLAANLSATTAVSLSPDGRLLAFAGTDSRGVRQLWIRPLGSLQARPLPGTEAISLELFFWSPDSRFIVFRTAPVFGMGNGKLKKVAVSGGPAESLCDVNNSSLVGGSWNQNGVIIFGQTPGGLMRVSATGGSASPLTVATGGGETDAFPQFLPDGRRFIYSRFLLGGSAEKNGIYVGSLDAKPEEQTSKRLLPDVSQAVFVRPSDGGSGYLLFGRDGTLMALPFDANRAEPLGDAVTLAEGVAMWNGAAYAGFSASDNGVLAYLGGSSLLNQLTWYDREGKVQGTVGEPSLDSAVNLSPDGKRAFVFNPSLLNQGLWELDFSRGTKERFTFGSAPAGGAAYDAVWSPNGSGVIFVSSRDGNFDSLYEKPVSGATDEVLLLKSSEAKHPRSWSRDGRYLFYEDFDPKTGNSRIRVLPLEGDKKPLPVQSANFNEGMAQISPDGRWLAYASDETGRSEVYVRAFSPDSPGRSSAAEGKWLISNGGGTDPRWREDGKELFFVTLDDKVMAVEVSSSPTFQAGVPKVLFQGPPVLYPFGATKPSQWGVASDGKRFIFQAPVGSAAQAQVTIVLNWQATLKE